MKSHIPQDKLIEQFKKLGRWISVTYGKYEIPASCTVADLDWNQMDQEHRPWIHKTYLSALRLATIPDAQLSVTRLGRFFRIPFFVSVSDIRVAPSTYYQGFTIFNLLYVHIVVKCRPGVHSGEWYIVSHPLFKPLHWFIDRKLAQMNTEQNLEDVPLRNRRAELRKRGYRFVQENPDFLTANRMASNVVFPELGSAESVSLSGLKAGEANSVKLGSLELLVRPDGDGGFSVWNEVCPHEGGPLKQGKICGNEIQCPWHGLKFSCAKLSPDRPSVSLNGIELTLDPASQILQLRPGRSTSA